MEHNNILKNHENILNILFLLSRVCKYEMTLTLNNKLVVEIILFYESMVNIELYVRLTSI